MAMYEGSIIAVNGVQMDPDTGYYSGLAKDVTYDVQYRRGEGQVVVLKDVRPNQTRLPDDVEIFAASGDCMVFDRGGAITVTVWGEHAAIAPCDGGA